MTAPDDAQRLYQDAILDHGRSPRNEGPLEGWTHEATTKNPLCGDRVTVRMLIEDGTIRKARFEARGCMIARASASILTEAVTGKNIESALDLVHTVDAIAEGPAPAEDVGVLEPLRSVREFPARVRCVTLPWRALETALVAGGRDETAG